MLCGVLFDKLGVITKIMFGGDESDRSQTEELMKPIANWLYQKNYLLGDNLCYLDFLLFEFLQMVDFLSKENFEKENPHVNDYQKRMRGLPKLK